MLDGVTMADAIAIFGVFVPAGAVIVAAIVKFTPHRNGGGLVTRDLCNERYDHIKDVLDEIRDDIKGIKSKL